MYKTKTFCPPEKRQGERVFEDVTRSRVPAGAPPEAAGEGPEGQEAGGDLQEAGEGHREAGSCLVQDEGKTKQRSRSFSLRKCFVSNLVLFYNSRALFLQEKIVFRTEYDPVNLLHLYVLFNLFFEALLLQF